MYLTTPDVFTPLSHGFHGYGSPTAMGVCPSDQPINNNTALLFPDLAPLAGARSSGCDHKAVWTFVPSSRPESLSVLVYLHGNNNLVTVDAAHPGGRHADWAPLRTPGPLTPGGPFAAGPKYGMDLASQSSQQRPVVIAPEDTVPPASSSAFWAVGSAGAFRGNPGRLGALITDCLARLNALRSPAGVPYFSNGGTQTRRLFLSGHSGGGVPLSQCAASNIARAVPTDLWLYDCTYSSDVSNYVEFVRTWRGRGLLANNANSSRMVILVTGGSTASNAHALRDTLERSLGMRVVRMDRSGFHPSPSPGAILEVASDGSSGVPMLDIERALGRFPVVLINTSTPHDHIPLVWTPRLLRTAVVP
jgi:hypothetical protein